MNDIQSFVQNDHFARHVGIELLDASSGRAKAKLQLTKQHLNSLGSAHGGAIFTLADFVFAVAANAHEGLAIAININISYVKAVTAGTLIAEAEEISLTSKLGHYFVRVTNEDSELIATFQGTAYRKFY